MKIVCLSDTHNKLNQIAVPDGDVLVHAGDATMGGRHREVYEFAHDMAKLPHKTKIFVAGNHDRGFQDHPVQYRELLEGAGVIYLEDSGVMIDGLRFWGSPWQPEFCDWAFNLPRGDALAAVWHKIPRSTDVLITHGPPRGILDVAPRGGSVGCDDLLVAVLDKKPKLHVFGHIHEGYGQLRAGETLFVNASCCTARYEPTNKPIVIEL